MKLKQVSVAAVAAVGLVLGWTMLTQQPATETQLADKKVKKKKQGRNRLEFVNLREEGFPLNVNPEHVSAADAPLQDGDMVMGIVLGGEARAYPVNYMGGPTNEVVNDTLGGQAIAPSW